MSGRKGPAARLTALAVVVRVALLAVASTACITDRILVEDGAGGHTPNAAQLERVQQQMAALRHLPFTRPVPADVMTVRELRAWFDRYADARRADLEREDRFFHRTGILPPTVSTAEAYKGFIADFVGGIYDDSNARMILISDYAWWAKVQQDVVGGITGIDWAYEIFLAHELDHALQDQHFGLGDMLKGGVYEDNDDAAFVRKTLLESEANVVGMAHFLGMDLDQLATRKAFFLFLRYNNLLNGPLLLLLAGRTPSYFAKQSFSQYELGLGFVEKKLDEGGMDALSRAYVAPPGVRGGLPESSEQLLWPRKMRAESLDAPVPIARLEQPLTSLPGSSLVLSNVFGALAFRHWLEALRGPLEAATVADGWGGDRWDLIDDGGHSVLVWRTTWDSDDDARQFRNAWVDAVPVRYGPRAERAAGGSETGAVFSVAAAPTEERFVRTLRDEQVVVEQRGRDVLIVEGVTASALAAVQAEAWSVLVRAATPRVDRARLAARAAELETHIQEAPRAPPRPDLLGRLFLPPRTMALRLGTGVGVDVDAPAAAPLEQRVFVVNDGELRWTFRPHLELSLPLGLTAEVRTPLGQTLGGVGLDGLFPSPRITAYASQAVDLGGTVVLAGQAALQGLNVDGVDAARRLTVGALLHPFAALVVAPAVARIDAAAGEPATLVVGSALRRGATVQPLVELEIVDGLFLTETSSLFFEARERGLHLFAHTHALGLLLYF